MGGEGLLLLLLQPIAFVVLFHIHASLCLLALNQPFDSVGGRDNLQEVVPTAGDVGDG